MVRKSKAPISKCAELYKKGLSCREISDMLGIYSRSVRRYLKRAGVKLRSKSEERKLVWRRPGFKEGMISHLRGIWNQKTVPDSVIRGLYLGKEMSLSETAAATGLDITTIHYRLRKMGIQTRNKSEGLRIAWKSEPFREMRMQQIERGEKHYNWKGGLSLQYGPSWRECRLKALEGLDSCEVCGNKGYLAVHHVLPYRVSMLNDGLIVLCRKCHSIWERGVDLLMDENPDIKATIGILRFGVSIIPYKSLEDESELSTARMVSLGVRSP